jgi:two-component system chemotaxis response regulator CheY
MLYYHGALLKRLEYTVMTAATPEAALKYMEQELPSLVLTGMSFPRMTGMDFIKALKCTDRTKAIPLIVLTAEENAAVRSVCQSLGAAAYLVKPVDPAKLYKTIQAATELTPRENIRIHTSLKVVLDEGTPGGGGAERTERATSISEGGLYLQTFSPKPQHVVTPIRIFIGEREIRAKAEVLYTLALEDGPFKEPGMAIKFVELSDDDKNYLRSFIKEQVTSGIKLDL